MLEDFSNLFYTSAEVRELLHCSRQYLSAETLRGKLMKVRPGVYSRESVDKYVNRHKWLHKKETKREPLTG